MINLCIFGGHGGQLGSTKRIFVTVFGGCELKRPTLARQIIDMKRAGVENLRPKTYFFLTLFGGTSIKSPTLAEEYIALQDALRAGLLTTAEWDRAVGHIAALDGFEAASLTLFGGFDTNELPTEDEELDALAVQRQIGNIPSSVTDTLMLAIGQGGAQRPAVIRRATGAAIA
ncbi:hypothetical protein RAS1_40800 [Phycisphaerae bacterium RAS1]|nr:hypothetical protein RAS1_40800 [Phycisphaerae bacterium RAS1]